MRLVLAAVWMVAAAPSSGQGYPPLPVGMDFEDGPLREVRKRREEEARRKREASARMAEEESRRRIAEEQARREAAARAREAAERRAEEERARTEAEIRSFLLENERELPGVHEERLRLAADIANKRKELDDLAGTLRRMGLDPEGQTNYRTLRAKLENRIREQEEFEREIRSALADARMRDVARGYQATAEQDEAALRIRRNLVATAARLHEEAEQAVQGGAW